MTRDAIVLLTRFCGGETDAVVGQIELGVEATDEDISEDPQRSKWRRDIQRNEAAQADSLAHLFDLSNIITYILISMQYYGYIYMYIYIYNYMYICIIYIYIHIY